MTSEGTSSNVCELTPSGTSPDRTILSPPIFLTILVIGDTYVIIFSLVVGGILVVILVEAKDSGIQLTFETISTRNKSRLIVTIWCIVRRPIGEY
jgi:hypothetical protein